MLMDRRYLELDCHCIDYYTLNSLPKILNLINSRKLRYSVSVHVLEVLIGYA